MQTLDQIPTHVEVLPPSGQVRVFRDSVTDIGYRECLIFIDGQHVAEVPFRGHAEIELEPGLHTIHASNRVFRTKKTTFILRAGDRLTFQVGNEAGGCFIALFILVQIGIPRIFLRLEQPEEIDGGALAIPDAWRLR